MEGQQRVNIFLSDEARAMLDVLEPRERKRGAYISELIMQAARAAGKAPSNTPAPADPAEPLRRELFQVAADLATTANHLFTLAGQPTRAILTRVQEGGLDAPGGKV